MSLRPDGIRTGQQGGVGPVGHLEQVAGQRLGVLGVLEHSLFGVQVPRDEDVGARGPARGGDGDGLVGVDAHEDRAGGGVDLVSVVAGAQRVHQRRLGDGRQVQHVGEAEVVLSQQGGEGVAVLAVVWDCIECRMSGLDSLILITRIERGTLHSTKPTQHSTHANLVQHPVCRLDQRRHRLALAALLLQILHDDAGHEQVPAAVRQGGPHLRLAHCVAGAAALERCALREGVGRVVGEEQARVEEVLYFGFAGYHVQGAAAASGFGCHGGGSAAVSSGLMII